MKDKKAAAKKAKQTPSQAYIPISEVKDGILIMKDGTFRGVFMVSSINFALKSEDEQKALIQSYVGFLNSIEFPLQIVVQSRKLQIQPYLDNLIELEKNQENELLKIQTADYRSFVKELVEMGQIMTKKFFVVVPYDPMSNKKKSFWARLKEVITPIGSIRVKEELFQKRKREINLRLRAVSSGLQSMGLNPVQLDTKALIELYYSTYNPDISFSEQLRDIDKVDVQDF